MPTIGTQTEITMLSETGYLGWLKANRDTADGTPVVRELSPKEQIAQNRRNAYLNSLGLRM